jgi:NAD(P)-dependent dehydrogenase (short-subunit alcohol dehydrogenase family)
MQIKNHTFLVTGGGSGLGAATAQMLIDAGANAVLADVNEGAGTTHAEALGDNAVFVATDVTCHPNFERCLSRYDDGNHPRPGKRWAIPCLGRSQSH